MRIYFSGMKREEWVAPMPLRGRKRNGRISKEILKSSSDQNLLRIVRRFFDDSRVELTGTTVLNRFVGHRELSQIVTNHISLFG